MTLLHVVGLSKRFGTLAALDGVDLEVGAGDLFCVVGPTNAGKSTLLKTIAGLHRPDAGTVVLDGRDITRAEPRARGVGLVFQGGALVPDRTGFDNVALPLAAAGLPREQVAARVHELARQLRIDHLLARRPHTFSGGEQKRVAIARALAAPAVRLLLLDEPLTGLDARLRVALRLEIRRLCRTLTRGVVYVTHDHVEAMSLGDRVAVLHAGKVQQIGTPDEVYRRPVNRFVAGFFGAPPMNLLPAELMNDRGLALIGDGFRVPAPRLAALAASPRGALEVGVPAEDIQVSRARNDSTPIASRVLLIERLGSKQIVDLALGAAVLKAVIPASQPIGEDESVWIGFAPQPYHLIDRASGVFLR